MDLLQNVKFMITTSYGILGMSLYTGVVVVVLCDRVKFKSSFFDLFCVGYFMNLFTYVNSFITLRLPQNTGMGGSLYNFFSNYGENNIDSNFPLNLFHTLHFEFAYSQYIFNCLICSNRFTAVFYPLISEKLWTRYWWTLIILMFLLPFLCTHQILINHSYYRYDNTSNSFSTETTYGRSNIYFYLMPSLVFLTGLNILFNVASCVKLYKMKKKSVRVPEASLFLMAFCVFVVDLFLTILTVLNFRFTSGMFPTSTVMRTLSNWVPILTPFASDALTLTHPLLLLIFSKMRLLMQALWPYHTNGNNNINNYRHITWDRYYVNEQYEKHINVSSGVAAGVTIGIFFVVFVLTFGCRIYSQYIDRDHRSSSSNSGETILSESIASDMWICGRPLEPPPPYDVAIFMPTTVPCSYTQM